MRRDIYLGIRVAISDFEEKCLRQAARTGSWQERHREEGPGF